MIIKIETENYVDGIWYRIVYRVGSHTYSETIPQNEFYRRIEMNNESSNKERKTTEITFHHAFPSDLQRISPYPVIIEPIVYQDPYTIINWSDGTKTRVKTHNEPFSKEIGAAMCVVRKFFPNRTEFMRIVEEGHVQKPKKKNDKLEKPIPF